MQDFEKNRIEYVHRLEVQVQALQKMVADLQSTSGWTPKINVNMEPEQATLTMELNQKRQSVVIPLNVAANHSRNDLCTAVLDSLKTGIIDQSFREIISSNLDPVQAAAQNINKKSSLA